MPSDRSADYLIIGGGHNGLVCAFYLARAGHRVHIVERRHILGGAAVTEEFHPGYRNSVAAYTVSLLNPRVIANMDLHRHGLTILERRINNIFLQPDGRHIVLSPDLVQTQESFRAHSARDAAALPRYLDLVETLADTLRRLVLEIPPNAGGGWREALNLLRQLGPLRHLDVPAQAQLIDLMTLSAADFLAPWFESSAIKAAFAFDGVVGTYASPYEPGTAYVLLHHCFGEVNGKKGLWGHAVGGMGAITQAMARACAEAGVTCQTDSPVDEVLLNDRGDAHGVRLEDGTSLTANRGVVANVGPRLLYDRMLRKTPLPDHARERMARYKTGSGSFRMNLALTGVPDIPSIDDPAALTGGIVLCPSLDYMDTAWQDARRTGWSAKPIIEMLIPSSLDKSLSPAGHHVASLFCQHVAPHLPAKQPWHVHRDRVADHMIATMDQYLPGLAEMVTGRQALSPADLENTFGLVDGDIFHGALRLNQMYAARPFLGNGDYTTPVKGLFLCGSGAHPGGGVTGAPGFNAARRILGKKRLI